MRYVRLWGIGAFAAIVGLVVVTWWLLAAWVVERTVEEVGSEIVGARVDVDRLEIGLFPASIALYRVQVTNPDEPMTNAVEVRRIAAGLDMLPLLRRKVLIDELAVEGLQIGTPRQRSGELKGGKRHSEEMFEYAMERAESLELPSFDTPDVAAILASEELESLSIIAEAQERMDLATAQWQERIDALPDQARFDSYRARFAKLRATGGVAGALAAAPEIAALQKEVRADIATLQSALAAIQTEAKELASLAKRAAAAPAADVKRLQQKYGLSPEGLANLSNRLLGPKIGALTARALAWWQRIEPLVARIQASETAAGDGVAQPTRPLRGQGIDVRFPERNPTPDLLIRRTTVSLDLESGQFSGVITSVTPDQPVHGQPLRFVFEGGKMSGIDDIDVRGFIDRVDPARGADELAIHIAGFAIEGVTLSDSDAWGLELERARMNLDLTGRRAGEELAIDANAAFADVRLGTRFDESSPVAAAIESTLKGIGKFSLRAELRGRPDDYELAVRSDMDRALSGAVSSLLASQMTRFRSELSRAVTDRTRGPLDGLGAATARFDGLEDIVSQRIGVGNDLLRGGATSFQHPGR